MKNHPYNKDKIEHKKDNLLDMWNHPYNKDKIML